MSVFKLIAVRPSKGCAKQILKNLKEDQFYFFDNSYEPTKNGEFVQKSSINNKEFSSFFYEKEKSSSSSLETINFQGVVGKNGEGKSSLIDFVIRLLNNFHYLVLPHEFNKLLHIEGVYGDLFFQFESEVYKLSLDENFNRVSFKSNQPEAMLSIWFHDEAVNYFNKESLLFFTLGINYSLYSWNALHYRGEMTSKQRGINNEAFPLKPTNSWLNRLFHKNDGYLTPIALHPYRNNGIIDVNNEEFLTKQRLLSLCINPKLNFNRISEDQKFTRFLVERKQNEFIKKISPVLDLNKATNIYTFISKTLLSRLESLNNQELINIVDFFLKLPSAIIENVYEINQNFDDYKFNNENFEIHKDSLIKVLEDRELDQIEIDRFFSLINKFEIDLPYVNDEILTMAFYLYEVREFWKTKIVESRTLSVDEEQFNDCLDYLVYKTISISKLYPKYIGKLDFSGKQIISKDIYFSYAEIKDTISNYINLLLNDRSHITLKIFQILNYVCNYNDILYFDDFKSLFYPKDQNKKKSALIDIEKYSTTIEKIYKAYYDTKEAPLGRERFYLECLPPPIYRTDIEIADMNGSPTSFDSLSSGERQLINVNSSIIYHLKNIDSIDLDVVEHRNLFSYDYVNIFLDEIELYFHPEYQRQFVNRLLFLLKEVNFIRIKGLNFILITHSPFILSDIPKNNVMFLEKGTQVYPMTENTFGANIHTLLQHGFFLNSMPIGEFAKEKINKLFHVLHNYDINKDEYQDLEAEILLVSEPFVKSQLLKLYHERKSQVAINKDQTISSLIERINELERRLNDRN